MYIATDNRTTFVIFIQKTQTIQYQRKIMTYSLSKSQFQTKISKIVHSVYNIH